MGCEEKPQVQKAMRRNWKEAEAEAWTQRKAVKQYRLILNKAFIFRYLFTFGFLRQSLTL